MKRYLLYFPILLVVLALGIDRLFTTPYLRDRGRRSPSQIEILQNFAPMVLAVVNKKFESRDGVTRRALYIGSSRSFSFALVDPKYTNVDPRLTPAEKRYLNTQVGSARLSLPMTDLFTNLVVADSIVKAELPIDAVVLEVSPFLLYSTLLAKTRWQDNIYGDEFLYDHFDVLPPDIQADGVARSVFRMYRYKHRPEKMMNNILIGEREYLPIEGAQVYANQQLEAMPTVFRKGYPGDDIHPAVYDLLFRRVSYSAFRGIYRETDFELTLKPVLFRIIERYQSRGIDVVLWLPPVHTAMQDIVYRTVDKDSQLFPGYIQTIKETGLPFYNGYDVLKKCDMWADASHLATSCYRLIALKVFQCLDDPSQAHCSTDGFVSPLEKPPAEEPG